MSIKVAEGQTVPVDLPCTIVCGGASKGTVAIDSGDAIKLPINGVLSLTSEMGTQASVYCITESVGVIEHTP